MGGISHVEGRILVFLFHKKILLWDFLVEKKNIFPFPVRLLLLQGAALGKGKCIACEPSAWRFTAMLHRPLLGQRRTRNLAGGSPSSGL